jgi:nucleoside-diphosphate-sugar epimerase
LFRPNFIGPNLDNVDEPRKAARGIHAVPVGICIDGPSCWWTAASKRSFTYIDDAIDCLLRIIERNNVATRRIFNINPANNVSIRQLAEMMIEAAKEFPQLRERAQAAQINDVTSGQYYGKYYQDIQTRVPSIDAVREDLGWVPTTDLRTAIRCTIDYYVSAEGSQRRAAAQLGSAA